MNDVEGRPQKRCLRPDGQTTDHDPHPAHNREGDDAPDIRFRKRTKRTDNHRRHGDPDHRLAGDLRTIREDKHEDPDQRIDTDLGQQGCKNR